MNRVESSKTWDDKKQVYVYTFKATSEDGKKTSIYTTTDYGCDGLSSSDGFTSKGDSSIWAKGQLSSEMQKYGYTESSLLTTRKDGKEVNLPSVEKDKNGTIRLTEGKEYNFGSFVEATCNTKSQASGNKPSSTSDLTVPNTGLVGGFFGADGAGATVPSLNADPNEVAKFQKEATALISAKMSSSYYGSTDLYSLNGDAAEIAKKAVALFMPKETVKGSAEDGKGSKESNGSVITTPGKSGDGTDAKVVTDARRIPNTKTHKNESVYSNEAGQTIKKYKNKAGNTVCEFYDDNNKLVKSVEYTSEGTRTATYENGILLTKAFVDKTDCLTLEKYDKTGNMISRADFKKSKDKKAMAFECFSYDTNNQLTKTLTYVKNENKAKTLKELEKKLYQCKNDYSKKRIAERIAEVKKQPEYIQAKAEFSD